MTPNFALALAFDGIRLLQRAKDGWLLVGEADVNADDLSAALATLRATALALDPSGLRTKLVIPPDQIKYLAIDTAQTNIDDVHAALDGATPYTLDQIVIDFERSGGRTHIAAVARETLTEAETFAHEHRFNPVAFVAVAEPYTFTAEVFFGPTSIIGDILGPNAVVTRDPVPIAVTGKAKPPIAKPKPKSTRQDPLVLGKAATPKPVVKKTATVGSAKASAPAKATIPAPKGAVSSGVARTMIAKLAAVHPLLPHSVALSAVILAAAIGWAAIRPDSTEVVPPDFGVSSASPTPEPVIEAASVAPVEPLPLPAQTAVKAPPTPVVEETPAATVGNPILRGRVLSPAEAANIYAATGVWQRAPRFAAQPRVRALDQTMFPAKFSGPAQNAKPTLPDGEALLTDLSFIPLRDPPPPGVIFPRDARGLILATPEGTITPDGAIVFAGRPSIEPPLRPDLDDETLARMAALAPAPDGVIIVAGRPDVMPPLRPAGAALPLAPEPAPTDQDVVTPGAVALSALAPPNAAEENNRVAIVDVPVTEAPSNPDITSVITGIVPDLDDGLFPDATENAVALSDRPNARPGNIEMIVARARDKEREQAAAVQPTATAQAPVTSSPPASGGVAQAATMENVFRLRAVSLIGVYGRSSSRYALVRLPSGNIVKVQVGSALDGGEVVAIGETSLNYVKRGRTITLELPTG